MKFIGILVAALLANTMPGARAAEPVPATSPPPATASQPEAPARIAPADLQPRLQSLDADIVVLDVRTTDEFAQGHVPGARNIPHDQLGSRLAELGDVRDRQVVLYCRSGRRSGLAARTLRAAGFQRLLQLEGDYPGWTDAGLPVEGATETPPSVSEHAK